MKSRHSSPRPSLLAIGAALCLLSLIYLPSLHAQTIERYSLSPLGGISSTCDLQVTFTMGEIAVTTEQAGGIILEQGFRVLDTTSTNKVEVLTEDQEVCSGQNIVLEAIQPTQGQSGTWSSTSPGEVTFTDASSPTAEAQNLPPGETFLIWTVTREGGCPAVSDSVRIDNQGVVSEAGEDTAFCASGSVTLGSDISAGDNFQWAPATGLDNPNAKQPIATPNTTTQYILTVTKGICSVSDTVNIEVSDGPTVDPVINTEDDAVACTADGFELSASTPGQGETGLWTSSNPQITFSPNANAPNATVNNLPEDVTIILKWEIEKGGCASENPDSIRITNTGGLSDATINAEDTVTLCNETTLALTANQPGTGETGTWSASGGSVSFLPNNTSPNVTVNNIPESAIELTWTISAPGSGCPDSKKSITLESASPDVDLGEDVSTCEGDPVTLIASDPDLTYEWRRNNTPLAETSFMLDQVTEPGVYTARGFASPTCFAEDQITVEISENLSVRIIGDTAICNGESATLETNYPNAATYNWSTNETSATINVDAPGLVSVQIVSDNGCEGEGSILISQESYTLSVSPKDTTIAEGGSAQIKVDPDPVFVAYSWNPPTNLTCDNCPTPIATPLEDQIYEVIVSTLGGCKDSAEVRIRLAESGTKEILFIPNIITPNGDNSNDSWIITNLDEFSEKRIKIYDRWGGLVFEDQSFDDPWQGNNNSGNALPSGTYFFVLEINTKNGWDQCSGEIVVLR